MKRLLGIILIAATIPHIHSYRPVRPKETEIPLLGAQSTAQNHQSHEGNPLLFDESTQQIMIAGSLLATGYMLQYDIHNALNDPLKKQALIKGCAAYITGKQIQHFYKGNPIAQEAGTLLAHYGRTLVALLLIYG